jgi:hypothetical protein
MRGAGVHQTGCAPRMNDSPAAGSARGHAGLLVDRGAAEQLVRPITRQHDLDLLACLAGDEPQRHRRHSGPWPRRIGIPALRNRRLSSAPAGQVMPDRTAR